MAALTGINASCFQLKVSNKPQDLVRKQQLERAAASQGLHFPIL